MNQIKSKEESANARNPLFAPNSVQLSLNCSTFQWVLSHPDNREAVLGFRCQVFLQIGAFGRWCCRKKKRRKTTKKYIYLFQFEMCLRENWRKLEKYFWKRIFKSVVLSNVVFFLNLHICHSIFFSLVGYFFSHKIKALDCLA